ncbi:MAG: GspH/FimT family pseudopilin [Gammaproteobacteria bacterium]|nr:GspH/FimT family pseudopilin [Gammaproteobacteria bacterium]
MDVKTQNFCRRSFHDPTACDYGFTIIELLTVLAIVAITTATALPPLQSFFTKNYLTSQINSLIADINLARSEAIKRDNKVILCESNNGTHCSRTQQWQSGWIIFSDSNHNNKRDTNELIIRTQNSFKGGNNLQYHGFRTDYFLSFYSTGITSNNGTFTLCSGKSRYNRAIIIARTGRARSSPTMVNGDPVSCNQTN